MSEDASAADDASCAASDASADAAGDDEAYVYAVLSEAVKCGEKSGEGAATELATGTDDSEA